MESKNKSILVIIGENVKSYRELEGMTLSEFACLFGFSIFLFFYI